MSDETPYEPEDPDALPRTDDDAPQGGEHFGEAPIGEEEDPAEEAEE